MLTKQNVVEAGAVSVGGLAAFGHFCAMVEPILADLSYLAAIVVAAATIINKIRSRGDRK